jgi:hypothetical protein
VSADSDGISLLVEVAAGHPGAGGAAQLGHYLDLGFQLSDAFSGDPMEVADLMRVRGAPSVSPYRSWMMLASRSDSVASTGCRWSCSSVNVTASTATTAWVSSMTSPRWESPSSPMIWSSEMGTGV